MISNYIPLRITICLLAENTKFHLFNYQWFTNILSSVLNVTKWFPWFRQLLCYGHTINREYHLKVQFMKLVHFLNKQKNIK